MQNRVADTQEHIYSHCKGGLAERLRSGLQIRELHATESITSLQKTPRTYRKQAVNVQSVSP